MICFHINYRTDNSVAFLCSFDYQHLEGAIYEYKFVGFNLIIYHALKCLPLI